jgi:hypothetical protein
MILTGGFDMKSDHTEAESTTSELEQKYPMLAEMARKGLIRLPLRPNGPGAYPRLPSVTPPGTAAKLLNEEREDR